MSTTKAIHCHIALCLQQKLHIATSLYVYNKSYTLPHHSMSTTKATHCHIALCLQQKLHIATSLYVYNKSYTLPHRSMSTTKLQQRNPSRGAFFLRCERIQRDSMCKGACAAFLQRRLPETAVKARKVHVGSCN